MPRQDVPYGGAICRLKERIAEIWDKLDQKLHSINGVEGDGAGNVEIASGNDAVVITNDQIGHRIEVALDKSKLPAASVSSVNGQTGAVMLDAAHIPSNGDSNVQSDIDWYKQRINECFDSIATEQDNRQNADATLQTNINAVSASIPEMSTTPDPYKGVERDAQGRAFAADPAAGVTDKTLVTANWVSQTGDASPNNLIHKTGDETKYGKFTLGDVLTLYNENWETAPVTIHKWPFDSTTPPTRFETINGGSVIKDVNDRDIWNVRAYRDTDGRDVLSIDGFAYDNTSGYLHYEIGPNGYRKIDTDGRMQAADPAAGATDKTLVTANWVSQTGNGAPNNLIHRSGNETRSGSLTGQSDMPFISKTPYPEFLQNGIPTATRQTFLNRLLDYDGNETCRFYEKHLSDGTKYIEIYLSVYGSDEVLYHPFIRMELTNDNKLVGRCSSRDSSNIADYSNNEIVTIGTLKKLGLI